MEEDKHVSKSEQFARRYAHCIDVDKGLEGSARSKDKQDRATNEQVLDPRTRMILFKMIAQKVFYAVDGCVSTGKEANVYHARSASPPFAHLALKIYKTSTLVFKDRDRYVNGEYRFRHGYAKSNPRKMVKVWAEKELRNLKRLEAAAIPCPSVVGLKLHVLVMQFLGDQKGWASPRIKDVHLPPEEAKIAYRRLLKTLRRLYQVCRLVHADFSEYNIIYHEKMPYIIDVSQSVEQEHPHALEFLRHDIQNLITFFQKFHVSVLNIRQTFTYITSKELKFASSKVDAASVEDWQNDPEEDLHLDHKCDEAMDDVDQSADAVFKQIFIPQSLYEVQDPENVTAEDAAHQLNLIPMSAAPSDDGVQQEESDSDAESTISLLDEELVVLEALTLHHQATSQEESSDDASDASDASNEDSDDDDDSFEHTKEAATLTAEEKKEARREHKRVVKEANREKRKQKMPKAQKKKAIRQANRKKK